MRLLVCIAVIFAAAVTVGAQHLGFDRNDYPGDAQLATLHQTFAFTGYWLNNPPGATSNSWAGKRVLIEKAGFGFLVLFNGKTYAQLKGNEAEEVGAADGQAAVAAAKREGFPAQTVIFLDQEEGGRLLEPQKDYLFAWIDAVSSGGFRTGVYCSGIPVTENTGNTITTAADIRQNAGDRHVSYFIANDLCPPSPGCVLTKPPLPSQSGIEYADVWQYVQSPRRPEYTNSCAQTYNADGNCYPPNVDPASKLHVDVEVAVQADPSQGRTAKQVDVRKKM
ncbi:MAG TPA: glycoside hydrolase domain-containing protein [Terriglobales bacterium]|nr:glycoside hydrolase domain-containing protein [Terriglobales bacterium]